MTNTTLTPTPAGGSTWHIYAIGAIAVELIGVLMPDLPGVALAAIGAAVLTFGIVVQERRTARQGSGNTEGRRNLLLIGTAVAIGSFVLLYLIHQVAYTIAG